MGVRGVFRSLTKNKAGNFTIMTALIIPVLVLSSSIALNLVSGLNAKNHLQAAADAASLAISSAYNAGTTDENALDQIAGRYLKANLSSSDIDPSSLKYKIAITGVNPMLAHVDVSGKMPVFQGAFLGQELMDIAASTTTTIGTKTYYQIAFLLDVSGSMAIGATTDDIAKLQATVGCQFACHDPGNYNGGDKAAVVQSALNIFVDKLKPLALERPGYFKMGIYTMGTSFNTYLPMTGDMAAFDSNAASVYLEPMIPFSCLTHNGFTSVADGFTGVLSKMTDIGDGSTSAKRQTYVVMISDGVQDKVVSCGRTYSDNYAKECAKLKAAGIKLVTIQTGYPEMDHPTYQYEVKPLLPKITKTLQACASDSNSYMHADDGPAIEAAIKNAFQTIFGDVRINS